MGARVMCEAMRYVLFYEAKAGAGAAAREHFPEHRAWFEGFMSRGVLLSVGLLTDATGGAMGIFTTREAVDEFVAGDPFLKHGVVDAWQVREWRSLSPTERDDMGALFTDADIAALGGNWSWLAGVSHQAMQQGGGGFLGDTLAGVRPWGFRPEDIRVPVLMMHGATDKMVPCAHGEWLAAHCPAAELRIIPDAGHITVLDSAPEALAWLAARADGRDPR